MLNYFIAVLFIAFPHLVFGDMKIEYPFLNDPIDVVIPAVDKDNDSLNLCIKGIRENCKNVRRIIVVSRNKLTDEAEWFNEADYPFSIKDIDARLYHSQVSESIHERTGWYYQQLLKLYVFTVIPDISSNVLILDSDTIFLNPVEFLNDAHAGLYNTGIEYHHPYFEHMRRLLPSLRKLYPHISGITHHMLFQKCVVEDLFSCVEDLHKIPFWQAFCNCVDTQRTHSGASEYEIYFNFVFSRTNQVEIRQLKWKDVPFFNGPAYKNEGYHYVSCHAYLRKGNLGIISNGFLLSNSSEWCH